MWHRRRLWLLTGENRGLAAPWHDTPTILARAQGARGEGKEVPPLLYRRRSRTKRERDLRARDLPGRRLAGAALALFCSWNRGQSIGDDAPLRSSVASTLGERNADETWMRRIRRYKCKAATLPCKATCVMHARVHLRPPPSILRMRRERQSADSSRARARACPTLLMLVKFEIRFNQRGD